MNGLSRPGGLPAPVEEHRENTLYLLASLCMIFMTMIVALQPIYLRSVLGVSLERAGAINAYVQVLTEVVDLLIVGYLGHLSDRYGRVRLIGAGFVTAAVASLLIPSSLEIGVWLGVGGLSIFILMRAAMSVGTTAIWPQLGALSADISDYQSRPRVLANTAFMLIFGATLAYIVFMQLPKTMGLIPSMYMLGAIALFGAWLSQQFLQETHSPRSPRSQRSPRKLPWKRVWVLLHRDPRLRLTFLAAFTSRADMVLVGLFLMLWMVYFADLLGYSQEEAVARGGVLIGMMGVIILACIPLWRWVINQYGRMVGLITSLALSACGLLAMGSVVNPYDWTVYLPVAIIAIGQAGTLVAPQVLTLDIAPPTIRGLVLGAFNTVGCIGTIIFIQAGGFLFDSVGPYAPFVLTGLGTLAVMCFGLWVSYSTRARGGVSSDAPGVAEQQS